MNHKEPEERGKSGAWILDNDLTSCFEFVQIYYNPKVFKNLKSDYYACEKEKTSTFKPDAEVIVLEEIKGEEGTSESNLAGVSPLQSATNTLHHAGAQHGGSTITMGVNQGGGNLSSPSVIKLETRVLI